DPACGSGSFLTAAIHALRASEEGKDAERQLDSILAKINGLDVNPIAVTIARANFVIALADLLKLGRRITIPIFVANSIKLPDLVRTIYGGKEAYSLEVEGTKLVLPVSIFRSLLRSLEVLSVLRDAIMLYH